MQLLRVRVSGDLQKEVCGKLNYLPSERARAEGQRVVILPTSFPSGAPISYYKYFIEERAQGPSERQDGRRAHQDGSTGDQWTRSASAPGPNGTPYKLYKNRWSFYGPWWEQLGRSRPFHHSGKGFPGCVEHADMMWEQSQSAKKQCKVLHVTWLDLTNTYGSGPHHLIAFALDFFFFYFQDLHMCFMLSNSKTIRQQLEMGITMTFSISSILPTFKVILIGCMSRQVDHLGQDEVQGQGQDQFKPVTWKLQGVVLQFHIVPKGNVATESVQSHLVSCEQDGCKDQPIHPQMARAPKMPLISKTLWEEHSPASPEINHHRIQAGECEDGDGAVELCR